MKSNINKKFDEAHETQKQLRRKEAIDKSHNIALKINRDSVGRIELYQVKDGIIQLKEEMLLSDNQADLAFTLYEAYAKLEANPAPSPLEFVDREQNPDDDAEDVKDRARKIIKHYMDYAHTALEKQALEWVQELGQIYHKMDINHVVRSKADRLSQVLGKMERWKII